MGAPLYFHHPACMEHDPSAHVPARPDTPERLLALERGLRAHDWLGYERRAAPAATEAERAGAPVGVVLEGGYAPSALAASAVAALAAFAGEERPRPVAPEAPITTRARARVARHWPL